jgi:hypothetical protein
MTKPQPTAPDPIFAAYESLANWMATPDPDRDRRCYLLVPDHNRPEPKTPFNTGLSTITGVAPKNALASFRKFLIEAQKFSTAEVDDFLKSRADQMPPVKRGGLFEPAWWDYGGFLEAELATFHTLFRQWADRKRSKNLPKKPKIIVDETSSPKSSRKCPETRRKASEKLPKKSERPPRKMVA